MKRILFFLVVGLVIGAMWSREVNADSALRTETVYNFLQDGRPYQRPIDFEIQCFGTRPNYFGEEKEQKVEKIVDETGDCQEYGCRFEHNLFGYHAHIQYCDLNGETQGQQFTVKNFAGDNLNDLQCHPNDNRTYDIQNSAGYFKSTPEYDQCMEVVRKEYYPDGNNFICHQYLEPTTEGECSGYGCISIDGQMYRFSEKTNQCIAEMDGKEEACDKYLQDVSSVVEKQGLDFDQICEVNIDLPVLQDKQGNVFDEPIVRPEGKMYWWEVWWSDFICWLNNLLGRRCR